MAKIHPFHSSFFSSSSSSSSSYFTSKKETFTIWMKSLILNGNGCTVFDSQGRIVYRVDNYDCICVDEAFLMDQNGKVLFTIVRKKSKFSKVWEGYRSNNDQKEASFQVRKGWRIYDREASSYEVMMFGLDKNEPYSHKIEGSSGKKNKSTFCKITDQFGGVVAQLRRKKSNCGVDLGDDVLTMEVEPNIDHSLIMGLVVTYSLINSKM